MRCSSPPRPWTPTWRGGWRNSWKRPAGIIWMRRSPAARSARRRANSPFSPRAAPPPSPRRGRRSMRWRQSSTNSAMPPAQGAAFKMINQLLAGVHIAAASEAIAFAAKQGLDIRKVYEVITASAGNSWMFENRMPHVLDGDYTPRSAVEIFVKDLGIIQDMARTAKFPVPVVGRGAADVPDDGGLRHGPRRRCLGGADVCPRHRHQAAGRAEVEVKQQEDIDAPFRRQSLHDVHRSAVPRPLRGGGESRLHRRRIPVSLRSSGRGGRQAAAGATA